ncbi:MAG: UvrD-helicase domain-containing protein [Xanthomonadales bacterium]|nr:UvrD-helicase domain-containing protein [Xanthomonadales bacterium]
MILDEPRNLVVAGAGTGKTSVLVAKVGYLLKSGACTPDEILLVAFNAKAAAELNERVADKFGVKIDAKTFHGLGNQILGELLGAKPPLTPLAGDPIGINRFISQAIDRLMDNRKTRKVILTFFLKYLQPSRPIESFTSERDYRAYLESLGLRTLNGERVKSLGELDIANFLFAKGVKYAYESRYTGEVPFNPNYRVYLPDFYLPDYEIYIEHFGVSKKGEPPPFVDRKKYLDGMKWKRELHRENATTLLENYSYQRSEGTLLTHLDEALKKAGVVYEPRDTNEIRAAAKDADYQTRFGDLVSTFLAHYRSNNWTIKALRARASRSDDRARNKAFLDVFEHIASLYENTLKENGQIDFSDMITQAEAAISSGEWLSPYKYILVDEFQDLSIGRYRFIQALLMQRRDSRLFAVGDDWQAIYRFAGSDISLMTGFRRHFGKCTVMKLDRTFRFDDSIEAVSSKFVLKNPIQIKKRLLAARPASKPSISVHWNLGTELQELRDVVKIMAAGRDKPDGTLLILARYKHDLPDARLLKELEEIWQPGTINLATTIHAAKGMQSDYVLVTDLVSGKLGFPSVIVDDPTLHLVLSEPERYPNAEERRLLYVALTRAKRETHVVTAETAPSTFAEELRSERYPVEHYTPYRSLRCPKCDIGIIKKRTTGRYGCTNLDECGWTSPVCPSCEEGFLLADRDRTKLKYACAIGGCDGTADVCPEPNCGGAIVPRTGKYGSFFGCSDYPGCEYSVRDEARKSKRGRTEIKSSR